MKIAGITINTKNNKKSSKEKDNKVSTKKQPPLVTIKVDGTTSYRTTLTKKFSTTKKYEKPEIGTIKAHIPGVIKKISVKEGDKIEIGDFLCILDAMKMDNEIYSPFKGVVESVNIKDNDHVKNGDVIFKIKVKERSILKEDLKEESLTEVIGDID